jgi:hypothetical protein
MSAEPSELRDWPADHVERRPPASLAPRVGNPLGRPEALIEQIDTAMREWEWTIPFSG